MKKETIVSIVKWSVTPILLIAVLLVIHHSKVKNRIEQRALEEKREKRELDEYASMLSDKYIYLDINEVYHTKVDCIDDLGFRENILLYSLQYIEKDSILDWLEFARTHQLCTQCFSLRMINDLNSRKNAYIPWAQQFRETDDELYRDADEEYYNKTLH